MMLKPMKFRLWPKERAVLEARSGVSAASALALILSGLFIGDAAPAHAGPAMKKTYGFVVSSLFTAINDTKYMGECPEGLTQSNDELWLKTMTPAERELATNGGKTDHVLRRFAAALRGPHGEDVCWNPEVVKDPPMRTVQGKVPSYGVNLDGTTDGHATAKSCNHEKFAGIDGAPAVDNQLFRILGCARGWRAEGGIEARAQAERLDISQGVILVEISNVSDLRNDDDVHVSFYRPVDKLLKDGTGRVLPYVSYEIDTTRYGDTTHGKIVDGVLTTNPIDVHLPFYGNLVISEMSIRDMRLKLDIAADGSGAKGIMAGYSDWETWWDYTRKIGMAWLGRHSCPALYEASRELADGYPDPATGQCTAISSAFKIEMIPAFVVHPSLKTAQVR
jgi:hypothetical protein